MKRIIHFKDVEDFNLEYTYASFMDRGFTIQQVIPYSRYLYNWNYIDGKGINTLDRIETCFKIIAIEDVKETPVDQYKAREKL